MRLAARELLLEEAVAVVVGGGEDRRAPRGSASARARGRPWARGRRGPRAGRSARTCAPRRGSPGSAGCCRRRAPRRASRPGSRGPWPPSACRAAGRSAPAWKRASSSGTASLVCVVSASRRKIGTSSDAAQLVLDPLGAGAVAGDGQRAARVAALGDAFLVAAVVAGDLVLRAVQDERDVAARALPRLPARLAREEVRPAAAVEQDDRLARGEDRAARLGVQRVLGLAHVQDADGREAVGARAGVSVVRGVTPPTMHAGRARDRPGRPAACCVAGPRARAAAGGASCGRSPGAAWPSPPPGARRTGRRGRRRRGGRRSAGRRPACRRRRAPRRGRSGRGCSTRGEDGGARADGDPGLARCAGGATRRSARPPTARSAAARPCPRSAPGSARRSAA